MKHILPLIAALSMVLLQGNIPQETPGLSVKTEENRKTCTVLEHGRAEPLDFLSLTPSCDCITSSHRIKGNSIEFTFSFTDGKTPVLAMGTPNIKDSIESGLHFAQTGVPDGELRHGTVCNKTGGMCTHLAFDFTASVEYGWESREEGAVILSFRPKEESSTVTFTVTVSENPHETYSCTDLASSLDFSKGHGKEHISWKEMERSVRENTSSVRWTIREACPICGNHTVSVRYRSPAESWINLSGREGIVTICPCCMIQLEYLPIRMS